MADMPAYDPESHFADGADDFADDLAGNVYALPKSGTRHGLYGIAQTQLLSLADSGKSELVRNIAGIVGLIRTVTKQVEGFGVEPFAGYARQASGVVGDIHDSLASKSVQELVEDGRDIVRHQPEIAVAAAVITGFIVARLVKARS